LPRFTTEEQSEECAFSGHSDFSQNGRAKIQRFSFVEEKWQKKTYKMEKTHIFLSNSSQIWEFLCIFAAD